MEAPTHLTRLNNQYSNINNRGSNGDSYYESFNIQFQSTNYRNTGLSIVANYTFAHATDDLSTTFSETNNAFGLGYTQPFNPGFDHGSGDLDIRNRFVLAPLYQTPKLRNKWINEGLGGWQVAGIYTVRTGVPFTYFDSTNNNSGYQVARYTPASGAHSAAHLYEDTERGKWRGREQLCDRQPSGSGDLRESGAKNC